MTTHSKERALTDREFELLVEGAQRLDNDRMSKEALFVVFTAGRLGLRAGEIIHMQEDWIDWRQRRIDIPRQMDCQLGEDGGVCGYCRQAAEQMATHYDADDVSEAKLRFYNRLLEDGFDRGDELTVEQALEMRWFAKTDNAARSVPFSFDARAELAIERFFETRDRWGLSKTALARRINDALEAADELDTDTTMPQGLRATAASHHASHGLSTLALQALLGWSDMSTARRYIRNSPDNTARELHFVHSQ